MEGLPSSAADQNRVMGSYTKKNLRDVENQAPKFDMPDEMDARFARTDLEGETLGLSIMKLDSGFRIPFGHKHSGQEEVYVEVVELRQWDAIRFDKDAMRNMEAGPDGIEYIAFGAGNDPTDAEMAP